MWYKEQELQNPAQLSGGNKMSERMNGVGMEFQWQIVSKPVKGEWLLLLLPQTFAMSDYFKRDSGRVDFNVKTDF